MEEFIRLFFTGEALQRMFACMCNNSSRDVQYKISNVITSMLKTTLCIRLTPSGLAPFRNDITMVLPYSIMDRTQLDFLDNITQQISLNGSGREHVQAMGIGNDAVIVTVLGSMRVWTDSCLDKTPLSHRYATQPLSSSILTGHKRKVSQLSLGGGAAADDAAAAYRAREDASRAVAGKPVGGSMRWQLDTLDVLKAFAACVFRSSTFKDDDMRNGICEIVVQMVIHEVGLTHNTVDMLRTFIQGIRANHAEEGQQQGGY